ncbi:hypothetical protein BJY52DRAFT_1310760 [Lactarius psammicola]|nr:hypothetical protein BJY52DRAFT_1310760 [Lactarius psammicola]
MPCIHPSSLLSVIMSTLDYLLLVLMPPFTCLSSVIRARSSLLESAFALSPLPSSLSSYLPILLFIFGSDTRIASSAAG